MTPVLNPTAKEDPPLAMCCAYNVPLCKIALGVLRVEAFAALWKALGSGASLSGFTMGCKWRWLSKTTEGRASGNEQQGDACGDGGMLRMRNTLNIY